MSDCIFSRGDDIVVVKGRQRGRADVRECYREDD